MFTLSTVEIRAALIAFLLAIVARFPAFLPGYAVDDYTFVNQGLPHWFDPVAAMNGRALGYTLYAGLARLGAEPPRAGVLYVLLLTAALIVTGLAACRLWKISGFGPTLLVLGFVALHPYQVEMFTFRTATVVAAIPLILGMAAILVCSRSKTNWFAALLLLTFAISIYQVVLSYLALLLVFSAAFAFTDSRDTLRGRMRTLGAQAALMAAAVAAYFAWTLLVSRVSGVALGDRTSLVGFDGIGPRLVDFAAAVRRLVFLSEPVLPLATKLILMAAFAFGFAACAWDAFHRKRQPSRRYLLAMLAAGAAGAPLCLGIGLVLCEFSLSPRAIAQTSLYVAGLFALLYLASSPPVRRVLTAATALAFFSFIGLNEQVLTDQLRLNERDRAEANRIVMRLELLPEFRQIRTVVLAGGSPFYPAHIRSAQADMNVSARFADWSKVGLLNEATGYAFQEPAAADKSQAWEMCRTRERWPAGGSVGMVGDVAVVCLPEN